MRRVVHLLRTASVPPLIADRISLAVATGAVLLTAAAAVTGHAP